MAIIKLPYNRFVVHNIREQFHTEPKWTACPMCHTALRIIGPSNGALSDHAQKFMNNCTIGVAETTTYCCEACGWFAYRENVEEYEWQVGIDHLLTSVLRRFSNSDDDDKMEWKLDEWLYRQGRWLLTAPADELGELMAVEIQSTRPRSRVRHVGSHMTRFGGRGDLYVLQEGDTVSRLLQVTRYQNDKCPRLHLVCLLNGIIYDAGDPFQALITIGKHPPYLVGLTDAPVLMSSIAGESTETVDAMLEGARHDPSLFENWIPLPNTFFAEVGHLRRGYFA